MQAYRRSILCSCVAVAALVNAEKEVQATHTPTPPPPDPFAYWSRDFNGPLDADPDFLALGIKFRSAQFSTTFQRSTDGGVLRLSDPVAPKDGGAFAAFGADFSQVFEDTRITGIVNPLGLPPVPPGDPTPETIGENNLGFLARGDLLNQNTYVGGINFIDGSLIITKVEYGGLYWSFKAQSNWPDQGSQPTLDTLFDDFKSRSYYLEFNVRTYRGEPFVAFPVDELGTEPPCDPLITVCSPESVDSTPAGGITYRFPDTFEPPNEGDVMLWAHLYDQRGGQRLLSTYWIDTYGQLPPGYAGVFVQSFDFDWFNPAGFPPLFGSFDDVTASVPEPEAIAMLLMGFGVFAVGCGGRIRAARSARRRCRAPSGAVASRE